LKKMMKKASKAFSEYLTYDSEDIVKEAETLLSASSKM
jgi:hypothetical protein